jgi:hypothetical protein
MSPTDTSEIILDNLGGIPDDAPADAQLNRSAYLKLLSRMKKAKKNALLKEIKATEEARKKEKRKIRSKIAKKSRKKNRKK